MLQVEERNNVTGPCCPRYECHCLSNEKLAQVCQEWNFTCSAGYKRVKTNSDCCPEYKCVCDMCVSEGGIFPVSFNLLVRLIHGLKCVERVSWEQTHLIGKFTSFRSSLSFS